MSAIEEATALKEKGNQAVKAKDWPTALDYYTKAIELNDTEPAFYSNRAQVCKPLDLMARTIANFPHQKANIKLEAYGFAIADATKALELDPNFAKVGQIQKL